MGFVPPPPPEPGYPGGIGPNFRSWLRHRQIERLYLSICIVVSVLAILTHLTIHFWF